MYSRVATFVSVVSGALLGALAALVSVTPPRPAPEPSPTPAEPPSAIIALPVMQASGASGTVPDAAAAPPVDAHKLSELSVSCSGGDPASCLRAAAALEAPGVPGDPARVKDHLSRAARIYTNRCVRKDPVACTELAALHAEGRGVGKSQRDAKALREHAEVLCRRHPTAACKNALVRLTSLPDAAASR